MIGLVCLSQADAVTYQGQVATALGYPRGGVKCAGGIVADGPTSQFAEVIKHPTLNQWAYCFGQIVTPNIILPPAGATFQTLDASWFPFVQTV